MLEKGFVIPIIESHGRFHAAARYEDELVVTSHITEIRTRAFRVQHTISRGDMTLCDGYEIRMWVRVGTEQSGLQAEAIPAGLRDLLSRSEA